MLNIRPNETLVYPTNNREVWGNAFWIVFHEIAANHSGKPSLKEKADKKLLFKLLARYLPCGDCSDHAQEYIRKHPLTNEHLRNPHSLFVYTCSFHNSVRERQGKPKVDCEKIYDPTGTGSQTCGTSCFIQSSSNNGVMNNNVSVVADIHSTIDEYKRIVTEYFSELCHRDNIPVPEVRFEPCPDLPSTSCNDFRDKNNPVVYMNPLNVNLRVVGHEYDHYRDFMSGSEKNISEKKANDFATGLVNEHFGLLKNQKEDKKNVSPLIAADSTSDPAPRTIINGPAETIATRPTVMSMNTNVTPFGTSFESLPSFYSNPNAAYESFPMYQQYMSGRHVEQIVEAEKANKKAGILSHIDGFYKWPSKHVGLSPEDLNLFNTTLVMKNVISTIIESNTTQLGSVFFSSMIGMILFISSSVMKKNLRYRDKQLLQLLAASFLWDLVRQLNPKNSDPLKKQIAGLIKGVKGGQFTKTMAEQLFETPKTWRQKNTPKQPVIMTQNGPVQVNQLSNVYRASSGDGDIDKVRGMISAGGTGMPISNQEPPVETGAINAINSPYGGTMIVDPSGQIVQQTPTIITQEGQQYYVPPAIDEMERLYQQYYNEYSESGYIVPPSKKLESDKVDLYRSRVNPYSFRVNY